MGRWDPSWERVVWSVDSASMEGVKRPESQGVRGQSKQAVQCVVSAPRGRPTHWALTSRTWSDWGTLGF